MYDDELQTEPVKLTCASCGETVLRSAVEPYPWVHADDFIQVPSLRTIYDHEAQPAVIDTRLADDPKTARPERGPFDPFFLD